MRISGVLQEHLSNAKRDVEMWLEGEISDKVEVDLGSGDLDTAVLRFLARNCPDKVQYLEREYQLKITERSMIFKGMSIPVLSHEFDTLQHFVSFIFTCTVRVVGNQGPSTE